MNPILVEALRGTASSRRTAARSPCSMPTARVLAALGDIERPVFPRSAVKVLQALPLVESGAADRLGLDDEELALACASHNGEPVHTAVVDPACWPRPASTSTRSSAARTGPPTSRSRALAAAGREPDALQQQLLGQARRLPLPGLRAVRRRRRCAVRARLRRAAPSGDARRHRGAAGRRPASTWPARRAASTAARSRPSRFRCATWRSPSRASAPASACAPATRARRAAAQRGGARAVHGRRHRPLRHARDGALGERVFCKVGAEGVYCAALPERGLGVAIKIDDGNNARAAEVAMAAVDRGARRARRRRARPSCAASATCACATGTASRSAPCAPRPSLRAVLAPLSAS